MLAPRNDAKCIDAPTQLRPPNFLLLFLNLRVSLALEMQRVKKKP
ncbi:hypothetical protein X566_01845 [Afipia sp. P52-10]|nr:hypothetical protein X566_01845 [Afipia sp. P52-10]